MILLLKLMAIFFYPLGFSLCCIVTGIVLLYLKKEYARYFLISGVGLLYIFSTPVCAYTVIRLLEKPYYPDSAVHQFPQDCSAIVVLGGAGIPMGPPRYYPEISDAGDRLLHASRLFKAGAAGRIITSGGFSVGSFRQNVTEGDHNAMLLREIGVDSSALLIDRKSLTTADHAPYIAQLLDSLRLPKKIILVTTASHMIRSVAVFKKYGYEVFPAAADFRSSIHFISGVRDFFPDVGALKGTTTAFHEIYGIIGYKVLGKI